MSQSTLLNPSMAAIAAAQRCHRQLQSNASAAWHRNQWWQSGTVLLAVLATSLAILPCIAQNSLNLWVPPNDYRIGLVLVGLALTIVVGVSNRLYNSNVWASLAAAVAAIDRAIYLYRTCYRHRSDRDLWLTQQVSRIQQQTQERLGGNWVMRSVESTSDEIEADALSDLQTEIESNLGLPASGYLQQRLVPQLEQSEQQLARLSATRAWYQAGILICAGLVVVPPVVNPDWLGWSTIPAIFGLALLFWVRTTSINRWLEVHSHLLLGLTQLRDYWQSLPPSEQTELAFFRLVDAAETLIESPYRQMADQLQEAIAKLFQEHELSLAQSGAIALKQLQEVASVSIETSSKPQELALEKTLKTESEPTSTVEVIVETSAKTVLKSPAEGTTNGQVVQEAIKLPSVKQPAPPPPAAKRGRPHAFVVMPFGRKKGPDGKWIDFNSIYQTLIKPAIEEAGFESFRADEEASSGDILTDMFQELLLADLVVADLSIDNANVFYELGIRHAFRRRGVVHIQAGRAYMPFDIITVRTLPYHCDDNGCPDPKFIDKDKQTLSKMIQSTWISERNRVHSPIFNLLTGLVEPDRKTLRTPQATGYWQEYTTLQSRIAIAQRQKRIGDVVLLAEEVSNPLIKEDIITDAGKALTSMGNSALALKQYRQGLKINPENIAFRCAEAFHLNRLGQSDEAIVKLEGILQDVPGCVDATNKLARIYKDLWRNNWIGITDETQRIRVAYESSFLLQKSIENYLRGYRLDQNEYYSGINALTLTALLDHLAAIAEVQSGDADEENYRNKLPALKGTIQFCLESSLLKFPNDQWAALSVGDLAVCVTEKPHHVATAYRKALALLWNNKFALQATLDQLKLMQLLNFRPEHVQAGISVLQAEVDRYEQQDRIFSRAAEEDEMAKPAQVFLFSGHMIDQPNRTKPRFPAAMEPEVTRRLNDTLNKLQANTNCTAILPGLACGGDILFVEACLERKMRVEIYLPFEPAQFVQDSVGFAGDKWVERFHEILNHTNITLHLQQERLGAVPPGDDPYERNNRWALYTALMHDIKRIRLIALWNGQGGDGLGGTADMVQQVRQVGGVVEHLDITKFDYWREQNLVASAV